MTAHILIRHYRDRHQWKRYLQTSLQALRYLAECTGEFFMFRSWLLSAVGTGLFFIVAGLTFVGLVAVMS